MISAHYSVSAPFTYGLCFADSKVCIKATAGDTSTYSPDNYAKYPNFGSYVYDLYAFDTTHPAAFSYNASVDRCMQNSATYFGLEIAGGFGHWGTGEYYFDNNGLGYVYGHFFWHF